MAEVKENLLGSIFFSQHGNWNYWSRYISGDISLYKQQKKSASHMLGRFHCFPVGILTFLLHKTQLWLLTPASSGSAKLRTSGVSLSEYKRNKQTKQIKYNKIKSR